MPTLWALLSPQTQESVVAATSSSGDHLPQELLTLDAALTETPRLPCTKEEALSTDSTTAPGSEGQSSSDDDDDDDVTPRQQRHQDRLHCGCGTKTRRDEGA